MLELAEAAGTTDIVATPHVNYQFRFAPDQVRAAYEELLERNPGRLRVYLGSDFHLNYDNLRDALDNPEKYTVNRTQYLMVELPEIVAIPSTRKALRELIGSRIVPIITHPERNLTLQAQRPELRRWIEDGCLLQVTAQSFLGRFGSRSQRTAEWLAKTHLVHFVASDAHDCTDRPPQLRHAYDHVALRYGSEEADRIFTYNPAAVLQGRRVSATGARNFLERIFRR